MSDCGMSGYETEQVCHYAATYFEQDKSLSGAKALLKALRKLGLAQDFILEKISTVLLKDERAILRLNAPKRPARESTGGAKVEWELRSREGDPLSRPESGSSVPGGDQQPSASSSLLTNAPWYKIDERTLFSEEPSDPLDELKEDLDLMLKLKLEF